MAYGALAEVVAAVLNAVVYVVSSVLGAVVVFSFVPALLAAVLLALLGRGV